MIVSQFTIGDAIPNNGLLLLRHGPKKKRNHLLEQTNLSEDGIRQVLEVAEAWDGPIPCRVLTSPIERCVLTASIIVQTNHWEQSVHESRLLGDPGPFVIDSKLVSRQLEGLDDDGAMNFFREHIEGTAKPGMASLGDGSAGLLKELVGSRTEGLLLAVSHDVIIAALAAHLGIHYDEWPKPLCGIVIQF